MHDFVSTHDHGNAEKLHGHASMRRWNNSMYSTLPDSPAGVGGWLCETRHALCFTSKTLHELYLPFYNLHWGILLKRTLEISFFRGHQARKWLLLLSTSWKTPAAAPSTAHTLPLNLIVVVQFESCDRHMNSKFACAMASCIWDQIWDCSRLPVWKVSLILSDTNEREGKA